MKIEKDLMPFSGGGGKSSRVRVERERERECFALEERGRQLCGLKISKRRRRRRQLGGEEND